MGREVHSVTANQLVDEGAFIHGLEERAKSNLERWEERETCVGKEG